MDVPPATLLLLDLAKAARKGHRDLLNLVHSCWCLNFTGVRCQTLRNWSAKRSAHRPQGGVSHYCSLSRWQENCGDVLIAFGGTGVVIRWLHFFEDSSFMDTVRTTRRSPCSRAEDLLIIRKRKAPAVG